MKKLLVISCLLASFCLMSCGSGSSDFKHRPVGNAGEILVIMSDYLWKGACGDSVRQYLTEPVWGLPAPEPMFSLTHKGELTTFLQKFRNIIVIKVDAGLENANLRNSSNVYARSQTIFYLDAPSADSIVAGLYRNKDLITSYMS